LEERRHEGVQGSMFRVQRFNSFWTLNIGFKQIFSVEKV
jgi:hypothetical protein